MLTWKSEQARCSPLAASSLLAFRSRTFLAPNVDRALVVSRDNERRSDLIVCFITSMPRAGPDMASLAATPWTGLKVPSVVRFNKLATLDLAVIAGKIGDAPVDWLASHRTTFFAVFGFGQP